MRLELTLAGLLVKLVSHNTKRVMNRVRTKNIQAIQLFVDFGKAFDSVHENIEQTLRVYPKEKLQLKFYFMKTPR